MMDGAYVRWRCRRIGILSSVLWLSLTCGLNAQGEGDVRDGSLSGTVHHINLYSEKGDQITPSANFDMPFSPMVTCGQCHDVDTIARGWHFEPATDLDSAGRPGEPWIYFDLPTATQIPLSYAPWKGTFRPSDVGLSDWQFVREFGRHMAGGGPAVHDANTVIQEGDRWGPSGDLGINCLSCHSAEQMHDQSVAAEQISRQNYRWAATATASFGFVRGSTRRLPETFQLGDNAARGPSVTYDAGRFFAQNKIFMKLDRAVANERCYFCHSTKVISPDPLDNLQDVHIASGIACVTCHGHGLDHRVRRGYETEGAERNDPDVARFSCRGCHLPEEGEKRPRSGQYTAPRPEHRGLPAVHFEVLSCTACHSGPWPKARTVLGKTSRSHALGTRGADPSDRRVPYVQLPVFAPGRSGKLEPHKLIWPAYWARLAEGRVTPLSVDAVKEAAGDLIPRLTDLESPSWPEMDDAKVGAILGALAETLDGEQAAYISGGRLYTLEADKLVCRSHEAAAPYLWPLAHNVRPARQALGIRGCDDCHDEASPVFFGDIAVDGPLVDPNERVSMAQFGGLDIDAARRFARSFRFRPLFKFIASAACALIALVLFWLVMRVLDGLISGSRPK